MFLAGFSFGWFIRIIHHAAKTAAEPKQATSTNQLCIMSSPCAVVK
jgi:hypothetical protein